MQEDADDYVLSSDVDFLISLQEDPGKFTLSQRKIQEKLSMVAHACNPKVWKVKAGGSGVQDQPQSRRSSSEKETLSQNTRGKGKARKEALYFSPGFCVVPDTLSDILSLEDDINTECGIVSWKNLDSDDIIKPLSQRNLGSNATSNLPLMHNTTFSLKHTSPGGAALATESVQVQTLIRI